MSALHGVLRAFWEHCAEGGLHAAARPLFLQGILQFEQKAIFDLFMKISTTSISQCVQCMIVFKNSTKVEVALEAVVFLPEPVGFITYVHYKK